MSAKYKSPSFLLPNELNTSANIANDTGINSLYSMDFNGTEYITAGLLSEYISLSAPTSYTISAWIKTTDNGGITRGVVGSATFSNGLNFYVYQGEISFGVSNNTSTATTTNASVNDGDWHHVVGTYNSQGDASGNTLYIYVDGVQKASNTGNRGIYAFPNYPLFIGAKGAANIPQNFWSGKIDEVAIFNRALNTTEIAALYDGSGSNIRPSNLMATNLNPIAYYPLGEQAQNSGYPNNPTPANNVWQFPNGVLQDYVMDFDGSDNINITDAPSPNGAQTLSMWINTSTSGNNGGLFTIVPSGATSDYWSVALWNSNIHCSTANTGSKQSTTNIADGNWHNIIFVKSSSVCTHIYIDGDLQTLSNGSWQGPINTPQAKIGSGNYSNTEYYFTGKISNVVLWTSDQSANKDNIYNNGSPQTTYTVTPQNWWKLNADSVYTPSAPNYTTALDFDSASIDYIETSGPNFTTAFSFSCWFKTSNTGTQTIWVARQGTAHKHFLRISGTQFRLRIVDSNGGLISLDNTLTTADGNWHHVCFTTDGLTTTDGIIVYFDGNPLPVKATLATSGFVSTDSNYLGTYSSNGTWAFDGSLSNASFWNTALTSAQVSTLFNFGTPETNISFSPTAWWKLDNTTTGIQDSSGNGYNGTNNGATDISSGVAVTPSWKIPSALTIPTINYTTALDFNRSEYDNLNTTPVTDFDTGDVSFSVWVFKDDGSTDGIVFSNSYNSGKAGITVAINDLERVSIKRSTRTHTRSTGYRNFGFTTNKWHQIAFTYDDSTHILRTFLDGQFKEQWSVPSATLVASTTVCVGGREPGSANAALFFDGKISNLTIFNSKLEDSDINTLYNSGQPLSDLSSFTTLATWWKLDNLTTGIQDSAGSINLTNDGATQVTSDVFSGVIPVNGVSTTLPSTALQQSDLQFDSPYSNYSLSFDGSSGLINCGSSLSFSTAISISAWFKLSSSGQDGKCIISKHISGSSAPYFVFAIRTTTSNTIQFRVGLEDNSVPIITGSTSVNDTNWHHVVGIFDGSNINIYIDGTSDATPVAASGTLKSVTNKVIAIGGTVVGGIGGSSSDLLNGKIDETSIFNYALSSAQILEIYNNGKPSNLDNFSGTAPISWWRLGENAYFVNNAITVPNSISGAPNGTGPGTVTSMLSADAPGTYANGIGDGLAITDRVGDAPLSIANSQSYNMIPDDKVPYVPGYVGDQISNTYSMTFDGTSSFNLGNSLNSTINGYSNNFSVSCWIKADAGSGSVRRGIIGNYDGTKGFYIDLNSSSANAFTIRTGYHSSATAYNIRDNTTTLVANGNTWYNVVTTVSGNASGNVLVYVNGVLENGTVYFSTPISYTVTTDLEVAHVAHGPANRFSGQIDEVAIFDKALTADQIKFDLYNATTTGKTADIANNPNLPTPVAWYRMGD